MLEMPNPFVVAVELALLLAGCVLLWRHALAPAARQAIRTGSVALAPWDIKLGDFFMFLWLVICGGVFAQLAATFLLKSVALSADATLILAGGAFQAGMLGGALIFLLRFNRAPATRPPAGGTGVFAAGLATFLIAVPVITATSLLWQALLELLGVAATPQDLIGIFANAGFSPLLLAMILLATVLAPLTEELVFRAGIFRYTRTRLPRWVALLLPSVLFGALHGNLAGFVPLAVLGIIFALAYERTGRIAVPIIAHGFFNLHTIALIFAGVRP